LLTYVDQFGSKDVRPLVLVDSAPLRDKPDPELVFGMLAWTRQAETDRQKFTDAFVRGRYKKPQSEAYLQSVIKDLARDTLQLRIRSDRLTRLSAY